MIQTCQFVAVDGCYRCGSCGRTVRSRQRPTAACGNAAKQEAASLCKNLAAAGSTEAKLSIVAPAESPRVVVAHGPGTELKALLKDWLGIEASPTCSCNRMARTMNERGPEWCESEKGMAEILGVMRAEHSKRWADGRTRLPWTDVGARALVLLACRRAEAKASA